MLLGIVEDFTFRAVKFQRNKDHSILFLLVKLRLELGDISGLKQESVLEELNDVVYMYKRVFELLADFKSLQ